MKQWEAFVFPVSLTSLMYAGSLVHKSVLLADSWRQNLNDGEDFSFEWAKSVVQEFLDSIISVASNVLAWRNYVVVSYHGCDRVFLFRLSNTAVTIIGCALKLLISEELRKRASPESLSLNNML